MRKRHGRRIYNKILKEVTDGQKFGLLTITFRVKNWASSVQFLTVGHLHNYDSTALPKGILEPDDVLTSNSKLTKS